MNAPKKIWFDTEECSAGPVQFADDEIPYIREDLVEALVEAAEVLLRSLDWDSEVKEKNWWFEARAKARAALAKARGEL